LAANRPNNRALKAVRQIKDKTKRMLQGNTDAVIAQARLKTFVPLRMKIEVVYGIG
jgi:hypothetical protein